MADTATPAPAVDTPPAPAAPEGGAPDGAAPAPQAAEGQPAPGGREFRPRREGGRPGGREFRPRRKVCVFCVEKAKDIDYKDFGKLRRFISDRGKIDPRRKTGTCAKHQRSLSVALKRARYMALLPYTGEHIRSSERGA